VTKSVHNIISDSQLVVTVLPLPCLHSVIKYAGIKKGRYFDVFLTMHLRIILVINQLNAQILLL